jgi:hypothetical protein
MMACLEQVYIWEFNEPRMAMGASAESGGYCCCVADALRVCKIQRLVSWFANDWLEALEDETGLDVISALSVGGHGGM